MMVICHGCYWLGTGLAAMFIFWLAFSGFPRLMDWDMERVRQARLADEVRDALGLPEATDAFEVKMAFKEYVRKTVAPTTRPPQAESLMDKI